MKKNNRTPLRRAAAYLLTATLLSTGILGANASQASAAAPVKLEKKSATLTIKKTDKKTTYGKAVINVQYLNSVKVTKIKYTSKNKKIATVSSTGIVKAKKKGSTKFTVSVRYKLGKKAQTKKLTYKVKVVLKDLRKKATAKPTTQSNATAKPTTKPTKTPLPTNNLQNTEGKNAGDVVALNKIITEQKELNGSKGNPLGELEDLGSYRYTWDNQGFLTEIIWTDYELNGMISFSELKHLKKISCFDGGTVSMLDVSGNTALTYLEFCNSKLTVLDLSNNTKLETLHCYNNQLTSLNLSKNTKLLDLNCCLNDLTSLNVSNNAELELLECGNNQLTALDLSKNLNLKSLFCDNSESLAEYGFSINQLTSLNLSNNKNLLNLYCDGNQLTTLDLSNNTKLANLGCRNNQLISLNLGKNKRLSNLYCSNNKLTSLDLSNSTYLETLHCNNNPLTSLDLSNNTSLTELECDDSVKVIGYTTK